MSVLNLKTVDAAIERCLKERDILNAKLFGLQHIREKLSEDNMQQNVKQNRINTDPLKANPSMDELRLFITESVLLKEVEWLKQDYVKYVTDKMTEEDQLLQKAYIEQSVEHFKFVLAYFDAKYDKLEGCV